MTVSDAMNVLWEAMCMYTHMYVYVYMYMYAHKLG